MIARLSYEHVPPRSAFNDSRVLVAETSKLFGPKSYEQYLSPRGKFDQKGAGAYTICEKCNNETGHLYVPSYAEWARQGMRYLQLLPKGSDLSLPFQIRPLAVLKQIICMFASACGHPLLHNERDLRKFVLDTQTNQFPSRFRVYCGFMSINSRASRQSGVSGVIDRTSGKTYTFSEIAFPPFIYLLTIESPALDPKLQDITFFSNSLLGQDRQIHLHLETRDIASPFPGDYRSDREIRQVYRKQGLLL